MSPTAKAWCVHNKFSFRVKKYRPGCASSNIMLLPNHGLPPVPRPSRLGTPAIAAERPFQVAHLDKFFGPFKEELVRVGASQFCQRVSRMPCIPLCLAAAVERALSPSSTYGGLYNTWSVCAPLSVLHFRL